MLPDDILTVHSLGPRTNAKALDFFDAVAYEILRGENIRDQVQVIIVAHAYETTLPYIQSLGKVFTLAGVIFKNSTGSIRPEYAQCLRKAGIAVLDMEKANFSTRNDEQQNVAIEKIRAALARDKKIIIMDHGGYFAFQNGELLFHDDFAPDKLIAVTEYAANGEERWKTINVDRPVISIGYSQIKESSDFAAAEAVVDGALSFCQSHNVSMMAKGTKIGVIGFGRLGTGIVDKLSRNLVHPFVYDIDELKMSGLRHAHVVNRERLLAESDVIFCATGNKAIKPGDFKNMKDGAVIFTVTSPDDEMDLPELKRRGILVEDGVIGMAHIYKVGGADKRIFLPFNGESANVIFSSSSSDPTILQPYALHTVATINAFRNNKIYLPTVQRVDPSYENLVAQVWNRFYNPDYNVPVVA